MSQELGRPEIVGSLPPLQSQLEPAPSCLTGVGDGAAHDLEARRRERTVQVVAGKGRRSDQDQLRLVVVEHEPLEPFQEPEHDNSHFRLFRPSADMQDRIRLCS
jgi:hypothetical protein